MAGHAPNHGHGPLGAEHRDAGDIAAHDELQGHRRAPLRAERGRRLDLEAAASERDASRRSVQVLRHRPCRVRRSTRWPRACAAVFGAFGLGCTAMAESSHAFALAWAFADGAPWAASRSSSHASSAAIRCAFRARQPQRAAQALLQVTLRMISFSSIRVSIR